MPSSLVWTAEEDAALRALVEEYGPKKWSMISAELGSKSSKQCRRRWKNALSIEAKATTWNAEEDALLRALHRELGNKWTEISRRFGDRTDNAVKNRWTALCRKQPDLGNEGSPITTVGVRHGTRTRHMADYSSGEYSGLHAAKRPRRGSGSPYGSGSPEPQTCSVPGAGNHGGSPAHLAMPTPFDQRNDSHGLTPINIFVNQGMLSQHELQVAQQLNALPVPLHIEVGELPPLPLPPPPEPFFGAPGSGAALPRQQSFSLNGLIEWLQPSNPPRNGHSGGSGALGRGSGSGSRRYGVQYGAGSIQLHSRANDSSSSSSVHLSVEQRSLLSRLMTHAKSSAEQAQQAQPAQHHRQQVQQQPQSQELAFLGSLGSPSMPEAACPGFGNPGLSRNPTPSLGLGLRPWAQGHGQPPRPAAAWAERVDPLGRTRSSTSSGGGRQKGDGGSGDGNSGGPCWVEAAEAAIATVDAMPPPPQAPASGGPLTRRASLRRGGSGAADPDPFIPARTSSPPPGDPGAPLVSIAPPFTRQEIDFLMRVLSLPINGT